ncbi:MAG TPA: S8 family serine peptidase [Terriglobia bacterium]|nr:S8 family serine peptidase [Terriglobia bacterium]
MTGRRLLGSLLIATILTAFPAGEAHAAGSVPVIVKLTSASGLLRVLDLLGGVLVDEIPGTNVLLVNVPNILPVQSLMSLPSVLLHLLGIDWLEINIGSALPKVGQVGVLTVGANNGADWYKDQPAMQLIRSNDAKVYSTGRGVVIADINSQVDYGHPALLGHLTGGYDFVATRPAGSGSLNQAETGFLDQAETGFLDQETTFLQQAETGFLDTSGLPLASTNPAYGHGTLCAGIIAAMAPDSMIMPLRTFDDQGRADLFTIAKAIRYAANNGANVINMSFGALDQSQALKNSIDYAKSKGVILVASAGNNNTSAPQYPAAMAGVLTVAATKLTDEKASFSNYGNYVFADGPGVRIISAYPGGLYAVVSGTSFSAPEVAATAALIRSIRTWGIASSISGTAVYIDNKNPGYVNKLGYGRIDVLRAVRPD